MSVVSLSGSQPVQPNEANQYVVDLLERMLDAAKSGEIQGVAVINAHADSCTSLERAGWIDSRAALGCVTMLQAEMAASLLEHE